MFEFSANIVLINSSDYRKVSLVGIGLILISFCLMYITHFSGLSFLLMIASILFYSIGLYVVEGKGVYKISTDLMTIRNADISFGEKSFTYDSLVDLEFYYHSYYSQSPFGYFTETTGRIEYGLKNRVSFKSNGSEFEYYFRLGDFTHANRFWQTMNYLKKEIVDIEVRARYYSVP